MTHHKEKNPSVEMDAEVTPMIELVDKDIIKTSNHNYLPYAQEDRGKIENVNQRHQNIKENHIDHLETETMRPALL